MNRLNITDVRCAALFTSGLQPSDAPTGAAVAKAVQRAVRQFGIGGCCGPDAQEFGDHPEAAADRMQWVRHLIREVQVGSASLAWPASQRAA